MSWNHLHIDQMGTGHSFTTPPKRIISIVPSQTELLYDLELEEEVIGITKFCIHPNTWYRSKEKIGGTKNLSLAKIRELKPDLIIGNKEENSQADIEILQKEFPVWMSDIFNSNDALKMIESIGGLTDRTELGAKIANQIQNQFKELLVKSPLKKAVYLIWNDPIMCAGKSTFIDEVLALAGFQNLTTQDRYPIFTKEQLTSLQPEVLLLSSEPFPFKEKHVKEFKQLLPNSEIRIVNGEMFSWYGSRLLKSSEYFKNMNDI